ncbi:MAG: XrtA system polysaccharide deacetylase [Planctomycetaceae bacterium]
MDVEVLRLGILNRSSGLAAGSRLPKLEQSTRTILELAAKHSTRGTFFVLGWVAERYPQLVREIESAGHEIGCHSYWHQLIYELGPKRFRSDLIKARDCLQWITGSPIKLHRAPSFSITIESLWALDILIEEGFQVDSSIYPVHHDRYGIPGSPKLPHIIATRAGQIHEFPGMTCKVAGLTVPVGGGGYLRLFPWAVTSRLLRQIRKEQRPLNVYLHPWEVDTDQPRIAASLKSRFRHYQNLKTMAPKLSKMLTEFRLGTMTEVLIKSGSHGKDLVLSHVEKSFGHDRRPYLNRAENLKSALEPVRKELDPFEEIHASQRPIHDSSSSLATRSR